MNVSYQASLVNRQIRRFTGLYFACFGVTWVGTRSEDQRLTSVLKIILDMAHFMVGGDEVFHSNHRALFYPVDKSDTEGRM